MLALPESQTRVPMAVAWVCFIIMLIGAFSGSLDIAEGASGDPVRVAKLPSVALKLINATAAGAVGIWGVMTLPRARAYLCSVPGIILCAIAAIFAITCVTAISVGAIPITLVFIAYLLFVPTALTVLKLRGTAAAILGGCILFSLGALLLYIFVPRIGVFVEEFNDGIQFERLGGMSQPNHTGRSAMIGLLLTSYFLRLRSISWYVAATLFGLFLVVGVLAMSRTALLGVLVCFAILHLDLLLTRLGMVLTWCMMLGGVGVLFFLLATGREDVVAQKLLGAVTKTGDLEEVTQVTGRYEIWQRTYELIQTRPLQGYGMGANKIVLIDHLQSTHNILLHPTLAAGIGAGLLTLVLLWWNAYNVLSYPNLLIRSLSAYVIISGLTEDTIYETFPGACTLLWLVCCMWPISYYRGEASSHPPLKFTSPWAWFDAKGITDTQSKPIG